MEHQLITRVTELRDYRVRGADVLWEATRVVRVHREGSDYVVDIEYCAVHMSEPERVPLTRYLFGDLQPGNLLPMREMNNSHHRTNKPGLQFMSSTGSLVAYESRLEAFSLLTLDWEGQVAAIQGQPFTIHFVRSKKPARHTPDFLMTDLDGAVTAINVKPSDRLSAPEVQAQFDLTNQVCDQLGWSHRILTTPSPAFASNLQTLAGYRRVPAEYSVLQRDIALALQSGPLPFGELVAVAQSRWGDHGHLIRPVIFHDLWSRTLTANLDIPLSNATPIALAARGVRGAR